MTAATATKRVPLMLPRPCGACGVGRHDLCRKAYWNPGTNSALGCPCAATGQTEHPAMRCRNCHAESTPDNPLGPNLTCLAVEDCRVAVLARLDADPLVQMLRECQTTTLVAGQVVDRPRRASKLTPAARAARAPKAKTGACLCCGGPTKGGLFLPGHDARFVSQLAAQVKAGSMEPDAALAALADCNPALVAKYERKL